ncbi:MAG TPA: class I tRNA ligase family protein [Solirubrobacterales bacterium]|nr:class I tRNA ligase family protein [Solirubrobacterales bacterium]
MTPVAAASYQTLERRWQKKWRSENTFRMPTSDGERTDTCVMVVCPFTSGEAHMGHVRSYSIGDAYARFRRAQGDAVLFSIGFDAFGLPAETRAITNGSNPRDWVESSARKMCEQFEALGFSFDWERVFLSSDPEIYKWSQWLFLVLREAGLVFRREGLVDWCESCNTVLAPSQVEEGVCWRCHRPTGVVSTPQWFLNVGAYNDENFERLTSLTGWNKLALGAQRSLLSRVEGVEFELCDERGEKITVFAEEQEVLKEAVAVMISPQHPQLSLWTDARTRHLARDHCVEARASVGGSLNSPAPVNTGHRIGTNRNSADLPLFISAQIDSRYGPAAILVTPAGFREAGGTKVRQRGRRLEIASTALRPAARYRVSAFPISRQRAWGAPIPIVHCPDCGTVPVPYSELPVTLPAHLPVSAEFNILAKSEDFVSCRCPGCKGDAKRETDTLDCHFDATFQHIPLAVPPSDRKERMFDHPELSRWFPISRYVQGADIGGYIFDQRAVTKALRDLGHIDFLADGEPYAGALMHGMVTLKGRKMSKHLGNVVNPQQLVRRYGADAVRIGVLEAAAPAHNVNWSEELVSNAERFLVQIVGYTNPRLDASAFSEGEPRIDRAVKRRRRLARWCEVGLEKVTRSLEGLEMHRVTRELAALFSRIEHFGAQFETGRERTAADIQAEVAALLLFVRLLAPIAPHTAEELWKLGGGPGLVADAAWPVAV